MLRAPFPNAVRRPPLPLPLQVCCRPSLDPESRLQRKVFRKSYFAISSRLPSGRPPTPAIPYFIPYALAAPSAALTHAPGDWIRGSFLRTVRRQRLGGVTAEIFETQLRGPRAPCVAPGPTMSSAKRSAHSPFASSFLLLSCERLRGNCDVEGVSSSPGRRAK